MDSKPEQPKVICVAKPGRRMKVADARCGIELRPAHTGIPSGPAYGHVGRIRWPHWARPSA